MIRLHGGGEGTPVLYLRNTGGYNLTPHPVSYTPMGVTKGRLGVFSHLPMEMTTFLSVELFSQDATSSRK